jgi:hypothetical protein
MDRTGRILRIRNRGGDVAALQDALAQLGEKIDDAEGRFGSGTRRAVVAFQETHALPVTGVVDPATRAAIAEALAAELARRGRGGDRDRQEQRRSVRGWVRGPSGAPVPGVAVRARARVGGRERALGETRTDDAGGYAIDFGWDGRPLNLVVEAGPAGEALAASPVLFDAGPAELVHLIVPETDSAYRRTAEALRRVLRQGERQVELADVDGETVAGLAGEAATEPRPATDVVASERLAAAADLFPAAVYALIAQGVAPNLDVLTAQPPEVVEELLRGAVERGLVTEEERGPLRDTVDRLAELAVERTLSQPIGDRPPLAELLAVAGLDDGRQRILLRRYAARKGSATDFWTGLRRAGGFDAATVARTRAVLRLGALTFDHVPLVRALLAEDGERLPDTRRLARRSAADWLRVVRRAGVGAPRRFTDSAANAEQARRDYAGALAGVFGRIHPTEALAGRIADGDLPDKQQLLGFLDANPAFRFETGSVHAYLREHPEALPEPDGEAASALTGRLERIQRLSAVTPLERGPEDRYDVITGLLGANVGSAAGIARMGESGFVRTFAATIGEGTARDVYARAADVSATAMALYGRFGAPFQSGLYGLGDLTTAEDTGIPDWETLFGSLDFCDCAHCNSVYSPAAYLVDLLHFLDTRPSTTAGTSAYGVLAAPGGGGQPARRPDLGHIELTCEATNTRLPYIDLVNEVLENAVAPVAEVPQTTGDAASLRAHPEHLSTAAYDEVAGAVYPFGLPFSLWAAEARLYLDHLGVSHADLLERLATAAGPDASDVAAARLNLTPLDRQVLTGTSGRPAAELWGMGGGTWMAQLRGDIPRLLHQAGIGYEDLLEVLDCGFVSAPEQVRIEFSEPGCDLSTADAPDMTAATFDRLHRFLRLRAKLGWTTGEVDAAIEVLGGGTLNEALLTRLGDVVRLAADLRVPVLTLLSVYRATVFTTGFGDDESLYHQVFLARSVSNEPGVFGLDPAGTELAAAGAGVTISEHADEVLGPLRINGEDLAALLEATVADELTLANLSALHRHAVLARALRLRVAEVVALRELSGLDPFDAADPSATVRFTDLAHKIGASRTTIGELAYLLRHRQAVGLGGAPPPDRIAQVLTALRNGLRRLADDAVAEPDPTGRRTATLLAAVLPDPADQARLLAIIDGSTTLSDAHQQAFLDAHFAAFADPADAGANLIGAGALATPEERFAWVQPLLAAHLRALRSHDLVVETFADALGLDAVTARTLLDERVRDPGGAGPVVDVLLDPAFAAGANPITPADNAAEFAAYHRLAKAALLITGLGLRFPALRLLFEDAATVRWLDPNDLPLASAAADPAQLAAWERMRDLAAFTEALGSAPPTPFDLLGDVVDFAAAGGDAAAARTGLLTALAERAGWNTDDVTFLAGPGGFGWAFPGDFTDGSALSRLRDILRLVRRVGAPAERLWNWRQLAVPAETARAIKQTARAKHDPDQWLTLAAGLRDDLREQQRDALTGYLIARDGYEDRDALFGHFLIDVSMNACMLTSRVKQAISSVQLFVNRCLMNLEPRVELTRGDADQWEWMRFYRVWEANRKVFLYPENWLEPELRDDKSPLFVELEQALLQEEVTDESAERAFATYLDGLSEIARLEVVGSYHQVDTDDRGTVVTDLLHVIARTRGAPARYYYRRRVDEQRWTPWERVEVDIESDHVVPFVHNRRLHLFWPVLHPRAYEEEPSRTGTLPARYFEAQVAFSEYRNGAWTPKVTSTDTQVLEPPVFSGSISFGTLNGWYRYRVPLEPADYAFKVAASAEGLRFGFLMHKHMPQTTVSYHFNVPDDEQHLVSATATLPEKELIYGWSGFEMVGCDRAVVLRGSQVESMETLPLPARTDPRANHYREDPDAGGDTLHVPWRGSSGTYQSSPLLRRTPGLFSIVPPSRHHRFAAQEPFFVQDDERTFLVTAADQLTVTVPPIVAEHPDDLILEEALIPELLWPEELLPPVPEPDDPLGPLVQPAVTVDLGIGRSGALGNLRTRNASAVRDLGRGGGPTLARDMAAGGFGQPVEHSPLPPVLLAAPLAGGAEMAAVAPGNGGFAAGAAGAALAAAPAGGLRSGAQPRLFAGNTTTVSDTRTHHYAVSAIGLIGTSAWTAGWFLNHPKLFRFDAHYHPFVCTLVTQLHRHGVPALLNQPADGEAPGLRHQQLSVNFFDGEYDPSSWVATPYPRDDFDFDPDGAYALYNWELFFHAPLLLATRLMANQRFAEARKWFHFIFDPTSGADGDGVPERFWRIKPFRAAERARSIQRLLYLLADSDDTSPEAVTARAQLRKQITEWRTNPFSPHAIARLRVPAYQKAVVMKYLDNLIAWGDQLFRRDSIETINEATQLYVLASQILGRRPERVPTPGQPATTFDDVRDRLDEFSNALVAIENEVAGSVGAGGTAGGIGGLTTPEGGGLGAGDGFVSPDGGGPSAADDLAASGGGGGRGGGGGAGGSAASGSLTSAPPLTLQLLFCVPRNDKLAGYWDVIENRLTKIRNCMNIEGIVRQPPLFEPPIDPGMLVKAAAAGLDLGAALSMTGAPLPHYRFRVMQAKALEACADVRALGAALLAALEKRDAEELARLRATHETQVLDATKAVLEQQITEASETLEALRASRDLTQARFDFYDQVEARNTKEQLYVDKLNEAHGYQLSAQALEAEAAAVSLIPQFDLGAEGGFSSPTVKAEFGGHQLSQAVTAASRVVSLFASVNNHEATMASIEGQWERRNDEWELQADLADRELKQIDRQITAAQVRVNIARRELANHEHRIGQAREIEAFLRDRYTSKQLYDWMVSQISTVYFQSYQLAFDLAQRAQQAYRFELTEPGASFVQFGHWDSLRKGLLAGERLALDLRRMDAAYLDRNRRRHELTRHVSLAMLDPQALMTLRATGACEFELPEHLFDLDHPGHYLRRATAVSLTVPAVTGAYTSVNARLTMLRNSIRVEPTLLAGAYERDDANPDPRFLDDFAAVDSIVTSGGQDDAGLFQLNLADERYLPCEGAGVISRWRLELPPEDNQFDFATLTDVVVQLRYTSRDGGDVLRGTARRAVADRIADGGVVRLLRARHEFADAWHRFLHPAQNEDSQTLELRIDQRTFPFQVRNRDLAVTGIHALLFLRDEALGPYAAGTPLQVSLVPPDEAAAADVDLQSAAGVLDGTPSAAVGFGAGQELGTWRLRVSEAAAAAIAAPLRHQVSVDGVDRTRLRPEMVVDLALVVTASVT